MSEDAAGRVVLGARAAPAWSRSDGPRSAPPTSTISSTRRSWARWEGDELVTYDLPGMVELLEYYTNDDYLIDND